MVQPHRLPVEREIHQTVPAFFCFFQPAVAAVATSYTNVYLHTSFCQSAPYKAPRQGEATRPHTENGGVRANQFQDRDDAKEGQIEDMPFATHDSALIHRMEPLDVCSRMPQPANTPAVLATKATGTGLFGGLFLMPSPSTFFPPQASKWATRSAATVGLLLWFVPRMDKCHGTGGWILTAWVWVLGCRIR